MYDEKLLDRSIDANPRKAQQGAAGRGRATRRADATLQERGGNLDPPSPPPPQLCLPSECLTNKQTNTDADGIGSIKFNENPKTT